MGVQTEYVVCVVDTCTLEQVSSPGTQSSGSPTATGDSERILSRESELLDYVVITSFCQLK